MRRIMGITIVLLALAGCATVQNKNNLRSQTLEAYGAALRWGDLVGARGFVDPVYRAAHPMTPERKALFATVQIAEYEASAPVATGPDTLEQTARLQLINKSSQRVYGVFDHQTWHWDASAKKWWLETGLPDVTAETAD